MGAVLKLKGSTKEDIDYLGSEIQSYQNKTADRIKQMLISLRGVHGGFALDQLEHCLQTATRAEAGGADREMIVMSLCHDVGKAISWENHGEITAEILRPFLSERSIWIVQFHQDFQGRHFLHHIGGNRDKYLIHKDSPFFNQALQFSEWDLAAFDPNFKSKPLTHFEPLLKEFFKASIKN